MNPEDRALLLNDEDALLHSLGEAQSYPDGVVLLLGDDGGQIYLVCPATLVICSRSTLNRLLTDLDQIAWPGNAPDMRRVVFQRRSSGSHVAGGLGGGYVVNDVWIHARFRSRGLEPAIRDVLAGRREAIA